MGIGWGGARVGAGRKKKPVHLKVLHGTATRSERKRVTSPAPVEPVPVPEDLTGEERKAWLRLAPHAVKAGTLTPATEYQFVLLCRNVVLERQMAGDAKLRAGTHHRGIIQRIDAELARFCLSPMGKPLVEATPKDVDPFARFDAVN